MFLTVIVKKFIFHVSIEFKLCKSCANHDLFEWKNFDGYIEKWAEQEFSAHFKYDGVVLIIN